MEWSKQLQLGNKLYTIEAEQVGNSEVVLTISRKEVNPLDQDDFIERSIIAKVLSKDPEEDIKLVRLILHEVLSYTKIDLHYKDKVVKKARQKHGRAYEGWTTKEQKDLLRRYENGVSVSNLSEIHGRSPKAIQRKLQILNRYKKKSKSS